MLQPADSFEPAERLGFLLHGIVAYCPDTRAQLRRSGGRRKTGRPARYSVSLPDGTFHTEYWQSAVTADNPKGAVQVAGYRKAFGLSAPTDAEAIAKANKRLSTL